jgi:hypothetical protein
LWCMSSVLSSRSMTRQSKLLRPFN